MLATAKNSLGVYASLSPSRRRCKAELAWSWSFSPRITTVFFVDCVFWLIASCGGPGLLLLPVRSSTGMRVTIFRVANYSVREARFFNFVNPFFILKHIQFVFIVVITTKSVKSRDSLAQWFANLCFRARCHYTADNKRIELSPCTKNFNSWMWAAISLKER